MELIVIIGAVLAVAVLVTLLVIRKRRRGAAPDVDIFGRDTVEADDDAAQSAAVGRIIARSAIPASSIIKAGSSSTDELTEALIRADVGAKTALNITEAAQARLESSDNPPADALAAIRAEITKLLSADRSLTTETTTPPAVWLFVGVNGAGKTTTIGKLARQHCDKSIVLAAGDTFRAAAGEQLEIWAERSGAKIVRGSDGADPASVVYDAIESAAAKGADLVFADTAGRLHTERNLMDELRKVRRVADKAAGTVTETLLVLDATTGQNGLAQARQFTEATDVTGIVLTKLDGSAKGGIVIAVETELGVPVKLVGIGEGINDLIAFDPEEFTAALFAKASSPFLPRPLRPFCLGLFDSPTLE